MSDELEHLTDEQKKAVLEIYPKEIKDLESTNEAVEKEIRIEPSGEAEVDKPKAEWKDGYLEYEVKNKESDHIDYEDSEIEVVEEDI